MATTGLPGAEIRAEVDRIAAAIRSLQAGEMTPGEFRRVRVIQGIYPIRGGTDRSYNFV